MAIPITDPADPHDVRHPDREPILSSFEIAVAGERPAQHAHRIAHLLDTAPGIANVEPHPEVERVVITYDARLTSPADIHESLLQRGYNASRSAD